MAPRQSLLSGWLPSLDVGLRALLWLMIALAYTIAVAVLIDRLRFPKWESGGEVAALLGFGLAILIGFRNRTAYDRWWEARTLWGKLNNESRNLILKARVHVHAQPDEFRHLARLLAGFAHALRLQLRDGGAVRHVPGFDKEPIPFFHAPGYLAGKIHELLARWQREGKLQGPNTLWILDQHASALMDVCGACERIRNTPLARSYRSVLRAGITLYVLSAPWELTLEVGSSAIGMLAIGFGFLLWMEFTAEAIEDPFGPGGDDLPLETYCHGIEEFVFAAADDSQSQ